MSACTLDVIDVDTWGWNLLLYMSNGIPRNESPKFLTLAISSLPKPTPTASMPPVVLQGAELNKLGLGVGQAHGQQKSNWLSLVGVSWSCFHQNEITNFRIVFNDWINFHVFFLGWESANPKISHQLKKKLPWIQVFYTSGSRHLWQ